ncbi:MAG: ribonuclease Z [Faecalibacterium sp.]
MLTITLLGTAATMPLPDRALTAAVAECAGHSLLFDCGEGTQAAARRAGVNLMRLDAICLTHYHGDHTFGLPGLLQTLACQGRTRPLAIFGPEGMEMSFAPLRALAGPLPYAVHPQQLGTSPVRLQDLASGWPEGAQLLPVPTRHRVPSRGYCLHLPRAGRFLPEQARAQGVPVCAWKRLQQGEAVALEDGRVIRPGQVLGPARRGLRFVFSGDTAPCAALEQAARGADLLICDATYPSEEHAAQARQYGHSTFDQSAALAARAGARRLWLAHYSPIITDPEAALPAAQEIFPTAECGFDGKQLVLHFEEEEA